MTVEKMLERKLQTLVKRLGGIALKLYCLSFSGLPDRMILMPHGKIYFLELKSTGKTPSPRQCLVHTFLRKLDFEVAWLDDDLTLALFIEMLEEDQNLA